MKVFLQILLFTLYTGFAYSQSSTVNYSFASSTNASMTDMSSGTTTILIPSTYNGDFIGSSSIGFDFWLMGTRYNYYSVNSNGLMRLGKIKAQKAPTNNMTNTANLPFLSALWDDLNSYTLSSTTRSRVISKVTGTAPNRVLTVEWKNFLIRKNATSGVQLSSWQVRLYETTGVFEFVYGRMQIATSSSVVKASIGMSVANASNKMIYLTNISSPAVTTVAGAGQNLVNSNVVGNIAGLNSSSNGSRTQYKFTSWLPNAAPTGLSFSAVTAGSMTLNWADNATNELGYVIYRSDDGGLTYNFSSQTAANATSSIQGALTPGTLYYWKVYAVTEGALGASLNGSQSTITCAGAATNTLNISTTGSLNWSSAAWSLSHPPTACENAVINFNRSSGGLMTLNMDVASTVNSLAVNGVFSGGGTKALRILTNGFSLKVLTDLNMTSTGGTSTSDSIALLAGNGTTVTVLGNTTIGQTSGTKKCVFGAVYGEDPDIIFKGNVTFNTSGKCTSPGVFNAVMGSYYFEGGASQTLTNNSTNSTAFRIYFGNVEIGSTIATNLTLGGSNSDDIYTNYGNLVINANSSLTLPFDAYFNQNTAGFGDLILRANATLKLGDNFGGQSGSNFPADYDNVAVDLTSTVEYYGTSDQIIYDYPVYGNLTLTNNSIKYITNFIEIEGNLTVNPTATFGCDYSTYMYGPSVINNGIIEGTFATSEFSFYGDAEQSYSGSGTWKGINASYPFQGLGVNLSNPSNVILYGTIAAESFYLFNGSFINSNNINIGSSFLSFVQRGGDPALDAGSFDTYPSINSTPNYTLYYFDALSNIVTGPEIPASSNTYRTYSDNVTGVTLTSDLTVSDDFELLQNTFDIGSNKLKVGNTITMTLGNMNGMNGTLEMNGTAAQTIPANCFVSNNLKDLIISNTNNVTGVTLAGTLNIYHSVTYGAGGRKLTTGDFLTLKSTAAETAWLGQMTANNSLVGNATVERYIPLHSKAWQFLSVPTAGQTIKASWQEGSTAPNDNLVPGYGTQLTGSVANATTQPTPGFDVYTPTGASIKIYNSGTGGYDGVPSTADPIANPKGYMLFVRGDRSATTLASPVTATTLRTKGTLYTPAGPPAAIPVSGFESIGNPYASAIDFHLLVPTGGVQPDFFYMWDPKLTTGPSSNYGFGGFQSFSWNGSSFDVTPGGGSYAGSNRYIESGQAFFVNAPFSAGTLPFTEACKVSGSNDVNKPAPHVALVKQLRTNFYVISGNSRVLLDGNLVQYDHGYSNSVDMNDALKLGNTGENLGLLRNGKVLVIERRPLIQKEDTIFYNQDKLKIRQYQFEFIPQRLAEPNLAAFFEDNYLHTSTPVSLQDTSRIMVNVINVPASYAPGRFRLVFRKLKHAAAPVTETKTAGNNTVDNSAIQNNTSVKNPSIKQTPSVTVYPNPVTGKIMQLHIYDQPAGNYTVQLINEQGQLVYNKGISLGAGDLVRTIKLNESIAAGTYQLIIISADGTRLSQQVIIQ